MPSAPSLATLFRACFCITVSVLVIVVGLSLHSEQANSVILWADPFPYMARLFSLIPKHKFFDTIIKQLTDLLEKHYPRPSPLAENSTRKWIFIASKCIYSYTNDIIFGSLACAILISFFISRHETPFSVFVVWVILVLSYLKMNGVNNA